MNLPLVLGIYLVRAGPGDEGEVADVLVHFAGGKLGAGRPAREQREIGGMTGIEIMNGDAL